MGSELGFLKANEALKLVICLSIALLLSEQNFILNKIICGDKLSQDALKAPTRVKMYGRVHGFKMLTTYLWLIHTSADSAVDSCIVLMQHINDNFP